MNLDIEELMVDHHIQVPKRIIFMIAINLLENSGSLFFKNKPTTYLNAGLC